MRSYHEGIKGKKNTVVGNAFAKIAGFPYYFPDPFSIEMKNWHDSRRRLEDDFFRFAFVLPTIGLPNTRPIAVRIWIEIVRRI